MKLLHRLILILLMSLAGPTRAQHQTPVFDLPVTGGLLPYGITLRETSLSPAAVPNLHSMTVGVWAGHWVLLAGRTSGLHGMTGMNAFDPQYENREVWVIDPITLQSWHKSLEETSPASGLTADQVDSLSSVNMQFHQTGTLLVVVGGYGYKRSAQDHKTYDTLSAIDLPGLIDWVKQSPGRETTLAADHIRQIRHVFFQVTGGSLEKIADEYQLIMGQNYEGRYRPNFNGIYTQQVRRFRIDEGPEPLSVPASSMLATPPRPEYRRRDLNVMTVLQPGTTAGTYVERAVVLSGVFTPENGAWTVPVVISPGGIVTMDPPLATDTFRQGFQIYHCAKVGLYHRATREMHMLLFGGLTLLEYEPATGTFTRDDQAPFSNQCGVVVRREDGSFRQFFLPTRFPRITTTEGKELQFGTNAEFFPLPSLPMIHPKVIDLTLLREEQVIGHIFGGIVADAGNKGNTGASGRIFEVIITPHDEAPRITISPSPGQVTLQWPGLSGHRYLVEKSEQLLSWSEASDSLGGTGLIDWSEPLIADARFFRVLSGSFSRPPEP